MNSVTKPTFLQALKGAGIAAAIAAVANNLYHLLYGAVTGFSLPQVINAGSITGASVVPLLLAGVVYFLLTKFLPNGARIFMIVSLVLTVLSLWSSFSPQLPDGTPTPAGFAGLSLPMHLIAGLSAAFLIPRFAK